MTSYPCVSVVITACDRPVLFRRAFDSVVESSAEFGLNVELIIVNDGKHLLDFSTEITEHLKIKYIQSPKGPYAGVARARNCAIDIALGEYILFLDDDDALNKTAIRSLYEKAKTKDLDLVYGNVERIHETRQLKLIKKSEFKVTAHNFKYLKVSNFIHVGSFIIKRQVIHSKFDEHLESHEDWEFLIANSDDIKVDALGQSVAKIFLCKARENRNPAVGALRTYNDYKTIYQRYPDNALVKQRENLLKKLSPKTSFAAKTVIDCGQMELLLLNPNETVQQALINNHQFEAFVPNLAIALLKQSGLSGDVVDIGSSIGSFAIPVGNAISQDTESSRQVHCFECQKSVFLHLCSHILINQLQSIINPNHQPLSDKVEEISVPQFDPFKERFTGSVSLKKEVIETRESMDKVAEPDTACDTYQVMETKTLDMLFSGRDVALIKLDVEGMESMILNGAVSVIKQSRPFILTESWDLDEFKGLRDDLINLLESLDYILFFRSNDIVALPKERVTTELGSCCGNFQFSLPES